MRFRDQVALTLPTLVLRLVLAIIFLWAGIGKFVSTATVTGDDAARLTNLGVHLANASTQPPPNIPAPTPLPDRSEPTTEQPAQPDPEPILDTSADEQRLQEILDEAKRRAEQAKKDAAEETPEPAIPEPSTIDPADPPVDPVEETVEETMPQAFMGSSIISVQQTTSPATASDFPEPMQVRRVYMIALLLDRCADPGLTANSEPIAPILPQWIASGSWARYLAIAAAVTECLAGFLLLIGFMTRFSAIGTLGVMLVALWTTQFGPAAMQSSDAVLGFIPNKGDVWNASAYTGLFLQLALASMSIAVVFLGSGPVGMDRVIFGAGRRDKYIHGDPKSAPPPKDRDPFDRSPNPTP